MDERPNPSVSRPCNPGRGNCSINGPRNNSHRARQRGRPSGPDPLQAWRTRNSERLTIVVVSLGLIVPFLFSAITDFTDSALFNISHREGMLDDFSNLVIEVISGNGTVETDYSTVDMERGQWTYVNVSVPAYEYTLSILAASADAEGGTPDGLGQENASGAYGEGESGEGNGGNSTLGEQLEEQLGVDVVLGGEDPTLDEYGVYANLGESEENGTGLSILGGNETIQVVDPLPVIEPVPTRYEELVQGPAEIDVPVSWRLIVRDGNGSMQDFILAVPDQASEITVSLFEGGQLLSEQAGVKAVPPGQLPEEVGVPPASDGYSYILVSEMLGEGRQLEVSYQTPAPSISKDRLSEKSTKIRVSSRVNVSNVTSYVTITPEDLDGKSLLLFLTTGGISEPVEYSLVDLDGDGTQDRLQWVVPQLGEETYEVQAGGQAITLYDSRGQPLEARIVINNDVMERMLSSGESLPSSGIEDGTYNVTVIPREGMLVNGLPLPISGIYFENLAIDSRFAGDLGMDNVPPEAVSVPGITGNAYAIDPTALNFTTATVRISSAGGSVLYKCAEWDFSGRVCNGEWIKFMDIVPGSEYSFTLTPEDPAFAEGDIAIINVQSYPMVGGIWTVMFNTTGRANLTIRTVNETSWDDMDTTGDLVFLELRCGETLQVPVWDDVDKVVFFEDYHCPEDSSLASRVLTTGEHHLEFTYGEDVEYAHNAAGDLVAYNLAISGSLPADNLTLGWSTYHAYSLPVINFTTWRKNGNELLALYVPFEGSGNAYNATDYSDLLNNATGILAVYTPNGGFDGRGAYIFSGNNNYVSLATTSFPTIGTANYTLEAWIKTTDTTNYYNCIFAINSYDPGFYVTYGNSLSIYDDGYPVSDTNSSISDGNWHHVAFVREGTGADQLKFYLDGQALGSGQHSGSLPSASVLRIGYDGYSGEDFAGTIDEFRFWTVALPAEQIYVHAQEKKPEKIVSQMIALGENWSGCVTPNDAAQDGLKNCSSNTTITSGTSVNSCLALNSSGSYVLTANLQGKNGANPECIMVNASDVTLGCNGYSLVNNESGTTYGILVDSSATGFTLSNCPNISNYTAGVYLNASNGHSFASIGLYNNTYGLYASDSNESSFNGLTMSLNGYGAYLDRSHSNNITESNSGFSTNDGIQLHASNLNKIDPSYYCNNTGNGITVNQSNDTLIDDSIACNNTGNGIEVIDSNNVTLTSTRMFNNSMDFKIGNSLGSATSLNMSGVTFDCPLGNLTNYTKLSLNDSVSASSSYSINWSLEPASVPDWNASFNGKYVNISVLSGTVSIDQVTWHWLTSEVGTVNESTMDMFEYNSSGWAKMSASLNETANTLNLTALVPHSVYGVLASNVSAEVTCVNLSNPSTYGDQVVNTTAGYFVNNNTILCTDTYRTNIHMVMINASNITLDCNNANLSGDGGTDTDYGIITNGFDFVTIKQCIVDNFYYDFYLNGTTNNGTFDNNTMQRAYNYQMYTTTADSNNITNNIGLYYSSGGGIYLASSCDYNWIAGNNVNSTSNSFYVASGTYNYFINNTADCTSNYGFYIATNYNNISHNVAYNAYQGFYVTGSYNNVTNNTADRSTYYYAFYVTGTYNNFTNNTATNTITRDGFYVTGSYNNFTGNNVSRNARYGFYVSGGDFNNLTDNTVYGNVQNGMYIYNTANDNILRNNSVYGNSYGTSTYYGTYVYSSLRTRIENDTVYGNGGRGIFSYSSNGTNITDSRVYNHTYDIYIYPTAAGQLTYFKNLTIDNPSGTLQNLTSIDMYDVSAASEEYTIDWMLSPAPLPSERASFAGKFVNISTISGTVSINNINWTWGDSEAVTGYNESYFELWKYNSSGWSMLNNTPNTAQNTLSLENMNPASGYAILDWNVTLVDGCMELGAPGTYQLTADISGANISASPYSGTTCIKITNPNVTLDCMGYSITNNGTGGTTTGILVNGTNTGAYQNIAIQNCPNVSGYGNGAYPAYVGANFTNSTMLGNSYNMYVEASNISIFNLVFYNSSKFDIMIDNTAAASRSINFTNVTFDNPAGGLTNYTRLYMNDSYGAGEIYSISWATNSSPLLTDIVSFRDKYVNISVDSGTVSIDSIAWEWYDDELAGYDELLFELHKYNTSGWATVNNTPDTANNRISLSNHNPTSIYAIVENQGAETITGCLLINESGSYTMSNNFSGANISAAPYSGNACIKIAAPNVNLNCQNYNISNNGTGGTTYGILVNGSASQAYSNVVIRNCQNVSFYSYGGLPAYSGVTILNSSAAGNGYNLYANNSNATITDFTAFNGSQSDFYVDGSGTLGISRMLFLNPQGTLVNYTNITMSDTTSGEKYSMLWNAEPAALPLLTFSFGGKYLKFTDLSGTISIDSIKWNWLDSELGGYNESKFRLWEYDSGSTSWFERNSTPNTVDNTLSLSALDPQGTFAILQTTALVDNCPLINSSGEYYMGTNFTGAPRTVSPAIPGFTLACVILASNDVVFDCNGYNISNNGTADAAGILINGSATNIYQNVTIRNCNVSTYETDVYIYYTNTSRVENVNASQAGTQNAFYTLYSDYINFTNNTAHDPTTGFSVGTTLTGGHDVFFNNTAYSASSSGYGFFIGLGNGTFENNTAYDCYYGFYINSNYNNFSNNTGYGSALANVYAAFYVLGANNSLVNNLAHKYNYYGFYVTGNDNNITDNLAYDYARRGVYETGTRNRYVNNTAHSCTTYDGYLLAGTNSTVINNTAYNYTGGNGFYVSGSYYTLTNNLAYFGRSAASDGFEVSGDYNTLTNNTAHSNVGNGFLMVSGGDHETYVNCTAYNNTNFGIYKINGNNVSINDTRIYNNTQYDGVFYVSVPPVLFFIKNLTIDNPLGTSQNFTSLDIYGNFTAAKDFAIKWAPNASALPVNKMSFAQKFVNITPYSSGGTIDAINWTWGDSELGGYDESKFELWKYNTSGWLMLNDTPNTTTNTLSLTDMNPASNYGILQEEAVGCQQISSAGYYEITGNANGASINASEMPFIDWACIKISSSDVIFDCNGYNITNDGTAEASAIIVNGSASVNYSNVTIRNCPYIADYERNIYLYYSPYGNVSNVTTGNDSGYDLWLTSSPYTTIEDSDFLSPTTSSAVYLSDSHHVNMTNNDLWGGRLYVGSGSDYANITTNSFAHADYGIFTSSSAYHTIRNNIVYNQTTTGIHLSAASYSNVSENHVYFTTDGIYLYNLAGANMTENEVRRNSGYGLYYFNATDTTDTNSIVYNNTLAAVYLRASGDPFTVRFTNLTIDSIYGTMENYTALDIADTVEANTRYMINWTANPGSPGSLPDGRYPFAQKFVNISNVSGTTVSIDYINWTWLDSEVSDEGAVEGNLELWKHNDSAGWVLLNNTPDTALNRLSMAGLNPASTFAILEREDSTCRMISAPGLYKLYNNIAGAPINATEAVSGIDYACIKIRSEIVIFDCNGFNITNNGTANSTGIYVNGSAEYNVTIRNCPSISGYNIGMYLDNMSNATVTNTTARNNSYFGFLFAYADDLIISDNIARLNGYGFAFQQSDGNNVTNCRASDNTYDGFNIQNCNSTSSNFTNTTANGNGDYGIEVIDSVLRVNNTHAFDNANAEVDLYSYFGTDIRFYNLTIDETNGNMTNYTSLFVSDYLDSGDEYTIAWADTPGSLPSGHMSFEGKFVNITNLSAGVSIDGVGWTWLDSESSLYSEAMFELWKYNSSGWAMMNNSPDISGNTLYLFDMNPASDYGILSNGLPITNCTLINSPGNFFMANSFTGAPIPETIIGSVGSACIKVSTSNVTVDCLGYNITNNGTANAAGVLINGSYPTVNYSNITIRNCPGVSGYEYGFFIYDSVNSTIRNATAYNNSVDGVFGALGYNNFLDLITAYNNTVDGIYLVQENDTNVSDSVAYLNGRHGIHAATTIAPGIMWNVTAHSNGHSGLAVNASNLSIAFGHLYNNSEWEMYVDGGATSRRLAMVAVSFDNPNGNYGNYSAIDIADWVDVNSDYGIKWNIKTGPLPAGMSSFENKFLNISTMSGTTSIDEMWWRWMDYEVSDGNYTEAWFELWKLNNSGWYMISDDPSIEDNWIYVTDMNPQSIYAILQNNGSETSTCTEISSPGLYTLNSSVTGAPYVPPYMLNALYNWTCIKITAPNVIFDCDGNSITNNGTASAVGISFNSSNVTIRNCPSVSRYGAGVASYKGYNATITNVTAFNDSIGFYMLDSNSINVSGNTIYNSSFPFIMNTIGSAYSTGSVIDSNVISNGTIGMYLAYANLSVFRNNVVRNMSGVGIYLLSHDYDNHFINNTVSFSEVGIGDYPSYVWRNNFSNNTVYNNTYGISINETVNSTHNNTLIYNNTAYGYYMFAANGTRSTGLHMYNNGVDYYVYLPPSYDFGGGNILEFRNFHIDNDMVFDNPLGNYQNHSRLGIAEYNTSILLETFAYAVDWVNFTETTYPLGRNSVGGKFVNITNFGYNHSIQLIDFLWNDTDILPYNESWLELWRYEEGGFFIPTDRPYDDSPDTANNRFRKYFVRLNTTDSIDYGLLQFNHSLTSCVLITSPGDYWLASNISGCELPGYPFSGCACIKIDAEDVRIDGRGYNLTNNRSRLFLYEERGIFANGSYGDPGGDGAHNITIGNFTRIYDYEHGVEFYRSMYNRIDNVNITMPYNVSETTVLFGMFLNSTSYTNITNSQVTNYTYGFLLQGSSGNYMSSENNSFANNTAYNNTRGFRSPSAYTDRNNFTNNTAYGNAYAGFHIEGASYSRLTSNTAFGNYGYGVYLYNANRTYVVQSRYYNNTNDLYVGALSSSVPYDYRILMNVFDNPLGNMTNYTNLSITTTITPPSKPYAFIVNWTLRPSAPLPSNYLSFWEKFVNISDASDDSGLTLDSLYFHWNDSEAVPPYGENWLEMWKYNASGWFLLNGTPDTTNNRISVEDFVVAQPSNGNSGADYTLLYNNESCRIIRAPGNYTLDRNATGAPNNASEVFGIDWACIKIASSDVVLDCNGYNVTNNGTSPAAGIVINGTSGTDYQNVTLQNCPNVSGYFRNVYVHSSSNDTIDNVTVWNTSSTGNGFTVQGGQDIIITNSRSSRHYAGYFANDTNSFRISNSVASNSTFGGVGLAIWGSGAIVENVTTYDNNYFGMMFLDLSAVNMYDSISYDNDLAEFWVDANNSGTKLTVVNLTIDNPDDEYKNYTRLYFNDTMSTGEYFSINWSVNSTELPFGTRSFEEKFVNISSSEGAALASILWEWHGFETSGYNESKFALWKYNETSGWTELNDTPDTTDHRLWQSNMPINRGVYGILEGTPSSCAIIKTPGTYTLENNLTGAPINVSEIYFQSYINRTCIKISSSDVTFDCNGYNITNNGTPYASAIAVNGSYSTNYTNVTIKNCPNISDYKVGVILYNSSYDVVDNVSVYNSSSPEQTSFTVGIYFYRTPYSNVTNSRVHSGRIGIEYVYSHHNYIAHNAVFDNNWEDLGYGFYIVSDQYSTIYNNTAVNGTECFSLSNDYLNMTNNTAYNCTTGFYGSASNSNISRFVAYNDTLGMYAGGSYNLSDSVLFNNTGGATFYGNTDEYHNVTAFNNTAYGLYFSDAQHQYIYDSHLYNNTVDAIFQRYGSGGDYYYYVHNLTFDSAFGQMQNYTSIDFEIDNLGGEFAIDWTRNSSTLPAGRVSFAQKFVNITKVSGTFVVDSINWTWQEGELPGYDESSFELWKYNTSGWFRLNDTPNTTTNTLSLTNMVPGSDYGILNHTSGISHCAVISAPGTYNLENNLVGAPINITPTQYWGYTPMYWACIDIESSDVVLNCSGYNITSDMDNNVSFGSHAVGILVNHSTNVTIKDCPGISSYARGVMLYYANYSTVSNSTAYNGSSGLTIAYMGNNNVTNFTAHGQIYDWEMLQTGIDLYESDYNKFTNLILYDNSFGIDLVGSDWNNLSESVAYANAFHGIFDEAGSGNYYFNNTLHSNNNPGIGYEGDATTGTTFVNNIVYNNSFFGVYEGGTDHSNISNNILYNNSNSGYMCYYDCYYITVSNNTAYDNEEGISLAHYVSDINVYNNNVYGNSVSGIRIYDNVYSNITLFNNTVHDNGIDGIYLSDLFYQMEDVNLTLNTMYNNLYGLRVYGFYDFSAYDNHLFNNTFDANISNNPRLSYQNGTFYIENLTIDSEYGAHENYTSLDINDLLMQATGFTIDWTRNTTTLPDRRFSFEQKFVNISVSNGTVSLDSINWTWQESEVTSEYYEDNFELWKYNSSEGWVMLAEYPDTASHKFSMVNLNLANNEYGILELNGSKCMLIDEPGTYVLENNLTGHPINASEMFTVDWVCIKIATSNVTVDCNGYNITSNGTMNTGGIGVNGSNVSQHRNITIMNCPNISGYEDGIDLENATQSVVQNVSIYANKTVGSNGMFIYRSGYNNITNVSVYDAQQEGFLINMGSGHNRITGCLAYNAYRGFTMSHVDYGTQYNLLDNNTAMNCETEGYFLWCGDYGNSSYSNITNSIAQNNTVGFLLASKDLYIGSNVAYNNTMVNFYVSSEECSPINGPANFTLVNNTAYGLRYFDYGFYDASGTNITYINNTASNCRFGFGMYGGKYNYVENLTSYGNDYGFFAINIAHNNTLENLTLFNNNVSLGTYNSNNITFTNVHIRNSSLVDLNVSTGASPVNVTFRNITFDSPPGGFVNYTALYIDDEVEASTGYTINWTANSSTLPGQRFSFRQKFVNITPRLGTVSIDAINWTWLQSEVTGEYDENKFELWKFSASGWDLVNYAPDTGANVLGMTDMNPASDYGILQNNGTCMIIDENGTYYMEGDAVGAPWPVSNTFDTNRACIVITASNVTLDCNLSSITNDVVQNATGIIVNGSGISPFQNVSLLNCPGISGYKYGAYHHASTLGSVQNLTSYNNSEAGVMLYIGTYLNVTNSTARDNANYGFQIRSGTSEYNLINGSVAYNNSVGFRVYQTEHNTLQHNVAYNNTDGFYSYGSGMTKSGNNTFFNNTAYNNTDGFYSIMTGHENYSRNIALMNSIGMHFYQTNWSDAYDSHLYNNTVDLRLYSGMEEALHIHCLNLTIDNPYGDMQNYTSLYMQESLSPADIAGGGIDFVWAQNASALPADRGSFEQKFVNITENPAEDTISIDYINWTWQEYELLPGYNESLFELWKYNASAGWTMLNNTPNTSSNVLSQTGMDPSSNYGILQYNVTVNCPVITSPGVYVQGVNYVGAPNSVTGIPSITWACVVIMSSDVSYSCAGFNITNNGTIPSAGIAVNGSDSVAYNNITISDCPQITDYSYGLDVQFSSNDTLMDSSLFNNTYTGAMFVNGSGLTITNNTAYNHSYYGYYLQSYSGASLFWNTAYFNGRNGFRINSSSNISLTNNEVFNNTEYGIRLESSTYGNLSLNNVYNNTMDGFLLSNGDSFYLSSNNVTENLQNGFLLYNDSDNNTFYMNNASFNNGTGFYLNELSEYNNLTFNHAYNNTRFGFDMRSSNYNALTSNVAEKTVQSGFSLRNSSGTNLTNNTAFNSVLYGLSVVLDSNNTLSQNNAWHSNARGVSISSSSHGIFINDNAYNNTQHGFFILSSFNNTLASDNATNNTMDGLRIFNSNGSVVDPSWFCNNSGNGITVNNSNNTVIDDSVACNNTQHGILINNSNNTLVNRSLVYLNSQYGIYMENGDSSNFTGSNITNNTVGGVWFDSSSSTGNLTSNYVCWNGFDMNNSGTDNTGKLDRCDSFVNWQENGHRGCEYACSDMWHRFFGNASGQIVLRDNDSYLMYAWNATAYNIYLADYDSVIDWEQLQAIGRNTTDENSTNDFTELDTAFSTTSFFDNINTTYSVDGSIPKETANITVYGQDIAYVPMAGSAWNSTFQTGILWDMSDGGAEYGNDYNQSTVWVVSANISSDDTYGVYDYNAMVPYTLSTYEGASDLVTIYLELR